MHTNSKNEGKIEAKNPAAQPLTTLSKRLEFSNILQKDKYFGLNYLLIYYKDYPFGLKF